MADFARAQLIKYGWSEGKGLGKNEDGVVEPVKAKIKNNTGGIGFQDVQTTWLDEFLSGKKTEDFQKLYQQNKPNSKKAKDKKKFLKSSTLENGVLVECEENRLLPEQEERTENTLNFNLSDEDLFKACGGRTLHKAARHNIKMNGKLARIQQAEEELLAKMKRQQSTSDNKILIRKKKKKSKKK